MKIEIITDCTDIIAAIPPVFPGMIEGTIIQEVKEIGDNYEGLFCSAAGSYNVSIPKERCKIIEE